MPLAIFDLDGTLVNSAPDLQVALNHVMARQGLAPFSVPEVALMVGDGARALLVKAFAARGLPLVEAEVKLFLEDYEAHSAVLTRPYPGIVETLERLGIEGWQTAICTNKPIAATWALLGALRIGGYFDLVVGGDSLPVRKPDPGHVRGVLTQLGVDPMDAVMIGDHQNDIRAGSGAEVRTVFAAWGYGEGTGADMVAETPADLPKLLL
ncbi:HAD-IA family hydrolase [Roseococcus sp. YIM B11640]|uniref:HAD-IA family hydrolase n=1 Tax=Roseococcus sp. YIM B11640 TaxID=3133973 RepID=UPI003C7C9770